MMIKTRSQRAIQCQSVATVLGFFSVIAYLTLKARCDDDEIERQANEQPYNSKYEQMNDFVCFLIL